MPLRPEPRQAAEITAIRRSVWRYDWTRVAAEVLNVYYDSLSAAAPVTQSGPAEEYTLHGIKYAFHQVHSTGGSRWHIKPM
jgi:hypothetical protein